MPISIDMLICAGDLSHSAPVSRFSIKLFTFLLIFYSFKIIVIIINHNKSSLGVITVFFLYHGLVLLRFSNQFTASVKQHKIIESL